MTFGRKPDDVENGVYKIARIMRCRSTFANPYFRLKPFIFSTVSERQLTVESVKKTVSI